MGSDATLQNVGEIRARLQDGNVQKPNDAILQGDWTDTPSISLQVCLFR